MQQKVMSVRVPTTLEQQFRRYCERNGKSVSSQIAILMQDELKPRFSDVLAGRNIIKYNRNNDSFEWLFVVDTPLPMEKKNSDGTRVIETKEFVVLKKISMEFIEELIANMIGAIKERDFTIGKKNKDSVAVPKEIIGVKK
ncbi:MAG: hypothetical protein WC197_05560 [Candidatus Gastranaerophilaceae bacterium]